MPLVHPRVAVVEGLNVPMEYGTGRFCLANCNSDYTNPLYSIF